MRPIIAWALFYAGDLVSKPVSRREWSGWLYPLYNWLMIASVRAQGTGPGPWEDPAEEGR